MTALSTEQLDQLLGVLDDALRSDAPAVVSALQNLVLLTGLSGENFDRPGPLRDMTKRVSRLENEIRRLDEHIRYSIYKREEDMSKRQFRYDYNYDMLCDTPSSKYDYSLLKDTYNKGKYNGR